MELNNFNEMPRNVKKLRDFYDLKPNSSIYQKEFWLYALDSWIEQGKLKNYDEVEPGGYDKYLQDLFYFDEPADINVHGLGWTEAQLFPFFEEIILEDQGDYELVQDISGRKVQYFKHSRQGYMPRYMDHPIKDWKSWEDDVKWRLDPLAQGRLELSKYDVEYAKEREKNGYVIVQKSIGGYMFLRSLIGPEELCMTFYDQPDLIHDCMKTWFELSDYIISKHQEEISFDELFLSEDICYNVSSLISPDMIKEFLFPYYQQLYDNMKKRNKNKKIHLQIDTDGNCLSVLDLYRSIGCDYMSPFEVASGNDVVKIGNQYPDLLISGGIDKRILAMTTNDIDKHLDYVMPAMYKRGGYIPTCDHGIPTEVSFENYLHFRKRMNEYSK